MPRFAATILGLVLVAFSIGFNTVRYPVVWEMVNPARANESEKSAAVAQPAEPESPASPLPEPAKPIDVTPMLEVKATSEVADKNINDDTLLAEGGTREDDVVEAELAARKPLVPVTAVGSPRLPGNEAVGGAGISRLPPVNRNDPNLASRNAQLYGRSIPIYPTTGIE